MRRRKIEIKISCHKQNAKRDEKLVREKEEGVTEVITLELTSCSVNCELEWSGICRRFKLRPASWWQRKVVLVSKPRELAKEYWILIELIDNSQTLKLYSNFELDHSKNLLFLVEI